MKQTITSSGVYWRNLLTAAVVVGSLAVMLSLKSFGQNAEYHNFADKRAFFGVANFFDVVSNLAFLLVGIFGLKICLTNNLGNLRTAWIILFVGITLVSVGSAYYHLNPNNKTLVWDRLPMTVGFMGLFVALLGEYVGKKFGMLLIPALFLGASSVFYWDWTDDLRFYIWVQIIPLLTVPLVMILYRAQYSHGWMLLAALGFYVLAKITELTDGQIFAFTQNLMSGHTIKHLLSAIGCLFIALMLQKRNLLQDQMP